MTANVIEVRNVNIPRALSSIAKDAAVSPVAKTNPVRWLRVPQASSWSAQRKAKRTQDYASSAELETMVI